MNASEKRQFISDLCEDLECTLIRAVDNMPEAWGGEAIRQLMADIVKSRFNYYPMERSRLREYRTRCW